MGASHPRKRVNEDGVVVRAAAEATDDVDRTEIRDKRGESRGDTVCRGSDQGVDRRLRVANKHLANLGVAGRWGGSGVGKARRRLISRGWEGRDQQRLISRG